MKVTRSNAFTLIELLVVIGIIAVLAAIAFPVFFKAKKSAQVSVCLTNLKQLGTALLVYGTDNDELAPPYGLNEIHSGTTDKWIKGDPEKWRQSLMTYKVAEKQFWCDLDPNRGKDFWGFSESQVIYRSRYTSYMANPGFIPFYFGTPTGAFTLSMTHPQDESTPAECVYVLDAFWEAPKGESFVGNHDAGTSVNALYLDGHVKNKGMNEL